jgi:iron(III) transport system ATP-binding protein
MSAAIEFTAVSRRYGDCQALDAVSFLAPSGKVTAILGASGSGKSTVLRLAAGLERPDAGLIGLGGTTLSGPGVFIAPEKRRIGLVFQDFALFPHLSALANVTFGLAGMERAEARTLALQWLDRVGLSARADAYPHQLSGGEQQRVALARALAPQPVAILLDEPFSGLDRERRDQLRASTLDTLREAHITALFVTHDAEDAMLGADELVILHAGRRCAAGPPRQVHDLPANVHAARALGPLNEAPARIENGRAICAFGSAPTSLAGSCVLAARPEAIRLHGPGPILVSDRRPAGAMDRLSLQAGGLTWIAYQPVDAGPNSGETTSLQLAERGVFTFPTAD